MAVKSKAQCEKEFVDYVIEKGLVGFSNSYENGHCYWVISLQNGETRYWQDLSEDSRKRLEIDLNY